MVRPRGEVPQNLNFTAQVCSQRGARGSRTHRRVRQKQVGPLCAGCRRQGVRARDLKVVRRCSPRWSSRRLLWPLATVLWVWPGLHRATRCAVTEYHGLARYHHVGLPLHEHGVRLLHAGAGADAHLPCHRYAVCSRAGGAATWQVTRTDSPSGRTIAHRATALGMYRTHLPDHTLVC